MCPPVVGAVTATLGKQVGALFLGSLGLNLVSGLATRAATQEAANQTYQSALIANRSAEQAFAAQQEALAAQLKESRASKAQEKQAATIRGLQARGAVKASGRAGLTVDLLLQDQERQTANFRESINQALESASRQYTRNVAGQKALRDNRRNQLQSGVNQAFNRIEPLGSVLLDTAISGLNTYVGLTGPLGNARGSASTASASSFAPVGYQPISNYDNFSSLPTYFR